MSCRPAIVGVRHRVLLCGALGLVLVMVAPPSPACDAWTVGAGIAVLQPHGGGTRARIYISSNAVTDLAGIPSRFEVRSLSADPDTVSTLAVTVGCVLSPHWILEMEAGIPPRVNVQGSGEVVAPGVGSGLLRLDLDASARGTLVEQRIWNPVVAMRYRLGDPDALVRPFVSAGASFTWFTDETVRPAFDQAIDQRFGQPLALSQARPGRTRTRASIDSLWAPVLGVGAEWHVAPPWTLSASFGYVPLKVNARLRTTAADGTWLATTRSRSDLEVTGVAIVASYDFEDP